MRMTRGSNVFTLSVVAILSACIWAGGCTPVTIPVPINLDSNADFAVEAGTPSQKSFATDFGTNGPTIGSGSLEIDPTSLSLTDAAARVLGEVICADACSIGMVSDATCEAVCNLGQVSATVWIGLAGETDVFTNGDQYGPFLVTLSGTGEGIEVTPSTVSFDGMTTTLQAFEDRSATIGVEIVSPRTGTVRLSSIILNAGL